MRGVLFIVVLCALLAGAYLTFKRIQNPSDEGAKKDLFDMPSMAKDKVESLMGGTRDKYEEAMEME